MQKKDVKIVVLKDGRIQVSTDKIIILLSDEGEIQNILSKSILVFNTDTLNVWQKGINGTVDELIN